MTKSDTNMLSTSKLPCFEATSHTNTTMKSSTRSFSQAEFNEFAIALNYKIVLYQRIRGICVIYIHTHKHIYICACVCVCLYQYNQSPIQLVFPDVHTTPIFVHLPVTFILNSDTHILKHLHALTHVNQPNPVFNDSHRVPTKFITQPLRR